MIVITNRKSRDNWLHIRDIIGNLEYSGGLYRGSGGTHQYSLDERCGSTQRCHGNIDAADIIDVIGADAFKKMIENIWNADYALDDLTVYKYEGALVNNVSGIVNCAFNWYETPENYTYWQKVHVKLTNAGL